MKKYIILLSIFVILISGIMISTKLLDKHFGIEDGNSYVSSGSSVTDKESTVAVGSVPGEEKVHELSGDKDSVDNPEGNYVNQYEVIISGKFGDEDWKLRQDAGLTNEAIVSAMEDCTGLYAYENIGSNRQQLYAEILLVMQKQVSDIPLCSNNPIDIETVTACVLLDHPEIFYVDGYSYEKYMFAGNIQKIDYTPNYTMTGEEIAQAEALIKQYAETCFKGLPQNATEYDKVKYIYEYIILNTEYNLEAPENQNICSVFLYRESVCLGYAKALQYLLQQLDVNTAVVTGTVMTGEGHAWNLVQINGQYYYVDATWGDASYQSDMGGDALSTINYDYLCITTQDIGQTHIINHPINVPVCTSRIDNYYVKEGLYITGLDSATLEHIFHNAYANNQDCISIRCSDQLVFQNVQANLLDNQQIFQYLSSDTTTLAYTGNDKLYTYTFML